jgi:hypothetical protein
MLAMPNILYRVTDNTSFRILDAGTTTEPFNLKDASAKAIIEAHANWSNRRPTPLISMTDSRVKALEYVDQRRDKGRRNIQITVIDPFALQRDGVALHKMLDIVDKTGAVIKTVARSPCEWVCVHHIPKSAVIRVETPGNVSSKSERYIDHFAEEGEQYSDDDSNASRESLDGELGGL